MVTLSNEGQSSGGLYKRLLENAYHPSGSMPKYKLRKVSAVRDFPLGCGPNVPSVNLRPEENIIIPVGGDSVGYVVEANSEENFVIQTESRSLEALNVGKEVEACRGRVSAIRNFPPLCGTNALQEFKDEGRRVISGNMSLVEDENVEVKCEVIERLNYGVETGLLGQPSLCDVENGTLGETSVACTEGIPLTETVIAEAEELGGLPGGEFEKGELKELDPEQMEESDTLIRKSSDDMREVARKEIVLHPQDNSNKSRPSENVLATVGPVAREIVHGLMAAPYCPWAQGKSALTSSLGRTSESKVKKDLTGWQERPKAVAHEFEKGELEELDPERIEEFDTLISKSSEDAREVAGNEIVLYSQDNNNKSRPSENVLGTVGPVAREIVHGLMAAPYCPWGRGKSALTSSLGRTSESKVKKDYFGWRKRSKPVAKKSIPEADSSGRSSRKKKSFNLGKTVDESSGAMIVKDEGECGALYAEPLDASPFPSSSPSPAHSKCNFDVSLPPFGPNCSSHGDARSRVRETLRLFTTICRKLLQGEEAKSGPEEEGRPRQSDKCLRIDLQAAKMIKSKKKEVNTGHRIGAVPGVEVGDEFQYRVELAIVGIHRLYQGGIDYLKHDGSLLATSIVASGAYADDMENADVLIYSGQGGNVVGKNKQPEDQKLVKGNLALKNSISIKNPVRVIRGSKEIKASDFSDARDKVVMTYVYDGLYTVERYWSEIGKHGKMVFKFELSRIRGQPELARKEVKLSKQSKIRRGVCVNDISGGNESFPICAVNTTDNEKPPTFTYIAKMMYPDWFHQNPPKGCDCTGRCSDSRKCSCAVKNGGEIPYNFNGAIVEAKALVYECGPSCKCPPSCYNRVSQRGTKIKLEIFKTESRGWGVRSLSFIPSGSFICEYAGELLEDQEAEKRTGNDEYLFDIGKNCNDCSSKPDVEVESVDVTEEGGYTIDAAQYGNIGRFINHSCSPNLYAQNVLYDHEDKRMPHIMLFAAENIPALQELTYHYNYSVDQVRDSNGNIKMKSCYCGSAECTGRMY